MRARALPFVHLALLSCAPALPPPEVPQPVAEPDFPHPIVWTAAPEVAIEVDSLTSRAVERPFTRMEVIGVDSAGVRVRCRLCPTPVEGVVRVEDTVFEPLPLHDARSGSLAEFALAVRAAAERRDLAGLREVMVHDFTFSLIGPQTRDNAIQSWIGGNFAQLDRLVEILDVGLASRDGRLWAAPALHFERHGYRGPRAGFSRDAQGHWRWVFLVEGERP